MATAGECMNIVCLRCFHNKYGVPLSIARNPVTGISKSKGPSSGKPVCNLRTPIVKNVNISLNGDSVCAI